MKNFLILLALGATMFAIDSTKKEPILPIQINKKAFQNPIKVEYTNYRGEKGIRTIIPLGYEFGSNEYHKEEQWLLKVWDCDRQAERVYAAKEITRWFVE